MSDFRADGAAALEWAARYLEGVRQLPVLSRVEPGAVRAALPAAPPDKPEPFAAVLQDLDDVLLPGITHWNHPRFFAYFAISGSEPGILAELLAATLNVNAMLWRTSPAATELEELVLDWVAQLMGLPDGLHGHIEDTASTSTLAALAAARELRPGGVVLCSDQAHSSVEKAARILGLEARKVAVDDEFRMRPDALAEALEDAQVGAVVATVGTTSTTSVDPVPEIADLAEQAGAWLHVDAAYAGSAMICEELRWALEGCERADSVVVNPHKWLFTPVDCSCLFSRRPEVLRRAFSLVPEYLRSDEDATNLMDYGPALGRRFRALKLWAVIRCYGRSGLQERIREHVRLAQLFASWVEAEPGWEVVAPVPFSVVCFRREASDEENQAIVERANATGEVFFSPTVLRDRIVLRLAVGNLRTTAEDVERAWAVLREAAADGSSE
ncbi:MAG TPA: aminotransferase class V-fold PLP-dependent enzyme [Gaiellaceae bacterium]|jgi:aromatic-L-amino-acid decarboxylase|nr:aminotransferase class V-fold PLP-dependent enzyme [Gaiellaceae bacterium]